MTDFYFNARTYFAELILKKLIDFAVVENNRLLGVDSNVFSTLKPCDHNSDMTNNRQKRKRYNKVIILS